MSAYALQLQSTAYMVAPWNSLYDFGNGNFTVEAWIKPSGAGTIISRKSAQGDVGNGGFLLVLKPDGSFKLATDNGLGFFEIDSQATSVLNGAWHHIAGVRDGANLYLYLDSALLSSTPRGNATPPLNVNNNLRMVIGATDQSQEPYIHYTGLISDVRVWSVVRSQAQIVGSMTTDLNSNELGLVGYWKFDGNGNDASSIQNTAIPSGSVTYVTSGFLVSSSIPIWPTTLHNEKNISRSPFVGPEQATQLWATAIGGHMRGGPVVDAEGNIYVGGEDKKLYSLDAHGTVKWTYTSDYPFYPTPAIGPDGTIYGASDTVQALTSAGSLKWQYARRDIGMIIVVPLKLNSAGDTVYLVANSSIGSGDRIIALQAANGTFKWEMVFTKGSSSIPGLGPDGTVYVGSEESTVYALEPTNGTLKWKHQEAQGVIRGPISVDEQGNIYFCINPQFPGDNALICLHPDGSVKWSYRPGEYVANPPSIAIATDGTIYAGFYGMHAITPNGQLKWKSNTANNIGIYPGAAVVDQTGNVYFGTSDGKLLAYSATGSALWQLDHGGNGSGPVLAADRLLYFSDGQNTVYALKSLPVPITSAPTIQQVSYNGTLLSSQWTAVSQPSVTGYTLALFQNENELQSINTTALQGDLTVSLSAGISYTVKARATGSSGMVGPWSAPVNVIASAPVISHVVYDGGTLTATWSAVNTGGVSDYTLQLMTGTTIVAHTTVTGTTGNLAVTLNPTTAYEVKVQANGSATSGPWSAPVNVIASAPTSVDLFYNGSALVVSWHAVPNQDVTTYTAQLLKNAQLAETKETALLTTTFAESFQAGLNYTAQVRASGTQSSGPWSPLAQGPLSGTATYNYDELGQLHQVVNGSGMTITYTYDDRGNITAEQSSGTHN
jgi:YD repeat-containing protein